MEGSATGSREETESEQSTNEDDANDAAPARGRCEVPIGKDEAELS